MLEDPALYPNTGAADEHDVISTTRNALLAAHESLRMHSDAIKTARTVEENARKYARLNTARFGVV